MYIILLLVSLWVIKRKFVVAFWQYLLPPSNRPSELFSCSNLVTATGLLCSYLPQRTSLACKFGTGTNWACVTWFMVQNACRVSLAIKNPVGRLSTNLPYCGVPIFSVSEPVSAVCPASRTFSPIGLTSLCPLQVGKSDPPASPVSPPVVCTCHYGCSPAVPAALTSGDRPPGSAELTVLTGRFFVGKIC